MNRKPVIGDLIVELDWKASRKYFGLVHEIKRDTWGHGTAFITWSGESPRKYQEAHGYSCTNIHNCRDVYRVIRNGVDLH